MHLGQKHFYTSSAVLKIRSKMSENQMCDVSRYIDEERLLQFDILKNKDKSLSKLEVALQLLL